MMRSRHVALVGLMVLLAGAGRAYAQGGAPSEDSRLYVEGAAAATLGHKSDKSFGGEVDYRLVQWPRLKQLHDRLDVFVEFGRMGNVATTFVDNRAQLLANAIGASQSVVQKATYVDGGVKYHLPIMFRGVAANWKPYVGVGVGLARVATQSNFSVNGNDITGQLPALYQIELGNDLADSVNKTIVVIAGGVQVPYRSRYLIEGSYRYGRILARPGAIVDDVAINTQRVQIAFGVRF